MVQRKAIPERHELTEVGLVLHAERLPVSRHCRDLIRNSKSEYRLTALRVSKPHDTSLKKPHDEEEMRGSAKQDQWLAVLAPILAIANLIQLVIQNNTVNCKAIL
jgi:hypothetical protein